MQNKQNDSHMQYPSFYRDVIGSTTYFKGFITPTEQEWVVFNKSEPPVFMRHEPCIVPLGYFAQPITFEQFYEAVADAVQARLARISNLVQQAEMNMLTNEQMDQAFYPDCIDDDSQYFINGRGALIDYTDMPEQCPDPEYLEPVNDVLVVIEESNGIRTSVFESLEYQNVRRIAR